METLKSNYILERNKLLRKLRTPALSDANRMLGNELSDIVFDTCEENLKEYFGLDPKLKGPGEDLWVSPSDLLIGKVVLKPPLTSKHVRALTHKGILQIGQEIEKKYWNEMEIEKDRCIREQEDELKRVFNVEIRNIGSAVKREQEEICIVKMSRLEKQFEERLLSELAALEERLNDDTYVTTLLQYQKEHLNQHWEEQLSGEISKTVDNLTEQFTKEIKEQQECLLEMFENNYRKLEAKRIFTLEMERKQCDRFMKRLKHQLECKNIANMMYVLCMERRRCKLEKDALIAEHALHIENLRAGMNVKENDIKQLEKEKQEREIKITIRDKCIQQILRQYQKFVNYVLRATPCQAEFLLSVERILMFDLTEELAREPKLCRERNPIDGSQSEFQRMPKLKKWKEPKKSDRAKPVQQISLVAEDCHNCLNEYDLPEHLRPETDILPMFYYNNHRYIREDFRNMLSLGMKMSPSNEMWNENVEELLREPAVEDSSSIKTSGEESINKRRKPGKVSSHHSSVRFSGHSLKGDSIFSETSYLKGFRHSSLKVSDLPIIDYDRVGMEEERNTILAATNSLDLISVNKLRKDPASFEAVNLQGGTSKLSIARNSLLLAQDVIANKKICDEDEGVPKPTCLRLERASMAVSPGSSQMANQIECIPFFPETCSRLTQARDSVEIMLALKEDKEREKDIAGSLPNMEELSLSEEIESGIEPQVHSDSLITSPVIYDTQGPIAEEPKKKTMKTKRKAKPKKKKLKVLGTALSDETMKPDDIFTVDRIRSFVNMIKDNPFLIGLFTTSYKT